MNYIKLLKQGKVTIEQINDFVDEWHDGDSPLSLHEYLGMSLVDYRQWVAQGDKYLKKLN